MSLPIPGGPRMGAALPMLTPHSVPHQGRAWERDRDLAAILGWAPPPTHLKSALVTRCASPKPDGPCKGPSSASVLWGQASAERPQGLICVPPSDLPGYAPLPDPGGTDLGPGPASQPPPSPGPWFMVLLEYSPFSGCPLPSTHLLLWCKRSRENPGQRPGEVCMHSFA